MWAVSMRTRTDRGVTMLNGAILGSTEYPQSYVLIKVGIDVANPTGRDFVEDLDISDEQCARVRGILRKVQVRL